MKIFIICICIHILCLTAFDVNAQCGTERWNIKVLNDADTNTISWFPVVSTVEEQDRLPKEIISPSTPRLNSERVVYQIEGDITFFKLESDQDIHLILVGKDSSMVIEIPSPDCPEVQGTSRAPIFAAERTWINDHLGSPTTSFKPVTPPRHVRVTGLSFQDFGHGQRGIGANDKEIHPTLSITDAAGSGVPLTYPEIARIRIIPNPVKGNQFTLTIAPNRNERISQVSIFDVKGKEVLRPESPMFFDSDITFPISTHSLANGTYWIRVFSLTGVSEAKFLIER